MNRIRILILCLAVLLFASNGLAATVYLTTNNPLVKPGDSFKIDIMIDGVPSPGLGSWLLDMQFDNSLAELQSFAPFTFPWMVSEMNADRGGTNAKGFNGLTFMASPFGDGIRLAELTFECKGAGPTVFSPMFHFTNETFSDFTLSDLSSLDGSIEFRGLDVNQVPVPGALWLLGSGVAGLVALRRRFRK